MKIDHVFACVYWVKFKIIGFFITGLNYSQLGTEIPAMHFCWTHSQLIGTNGQENLMELGEIPDELWTVTKSQHPAE